MATALTTIVFHRFFFNEESVSAGRERLKRYCDTLARRHTPLSLAAATEGLRAGSLPRRPLLVTIDDALIDILDVKSVFDEFRIPIAIFACVGWCENAGTDHRGEDSQLASIVAAIEWYFGPDVELPLGPGHQPLRLGRRHRNDAIEELLAHQAELTPLYPSMLELLGEATKTNIPRNVCNWSELAHLKADGATIGCHSVSHVNLGAATTSRMAFEITAAQRVLREKLGATDAFAYPYGVQGSFNAATKLALQRSGFHCAFSTQYDFARRGADPFEMPRIALPERAMTTMELRARLSSAGVKVRRVKEMVQGRASTLAS